MSFNLLRSVPTIKMDDLRVSLEMGWAFQSSYTEYNYGENYWQNYINMESSETCALLNKFRGDLATNYADSLLDIGIGSGAFLKSLNCQKSGYDVNPYGQKWLKDNYLWHNPYEECNSKFNGFCFWDVLEHIENPSDTLKLLPKNSYIFVSLPTFPNLERIHLSKHYKPNEHLHYFTTAGFIKFMSLSGFSVVEIRSDETKIGRDSITTFVARKEYASK